MRYFVAGNFWLLVALALVLVGRNYSGGYVQILKDGNLVSWALYYAWLLGATGWAVFNLCWSFRPEANRGGR